LIGLAGDVTTWVNCARPLCVCFKNWLNASNESALDCANANVAVSQAKQATAMNRQREIISNVAVIQTNSFSARRHQNVTLTTAAHGTDQTGLLHLFHQTGGAVVANSSGAAPAK